ncbi:MAG: tRNA1(Val) (adenine(37)-N6)-methyltransferase [Treponema sp.]
MEVAVRLQKDEQIDILHLKDFKIVQNKNFFKFGIDAVLLENFVKVKRDEQIVDFCSGNGIIPVLLCAEYNVKKITGIEIQREAADLFLKSVRLNKLEEKVDVINDDIKNVKKYFLPQSVNVVTCNPPYVKAQNIDKNKNDFLAVARHEILCTLDDVMKNANYVLKPAGRIFFDRKKV